MISNCNVLYSNYKLIKEVGVKMRAPYQVLVFPYYISDKGIEYAIFHRSDADWWQAISYLKWDGNKVALWELNKRLCKKI